MNLKIKDNTPILESLTEFNYNSYEPIVGLNIISYLECLNFKDETTERKEYYKLLYSSSVKANCGSNGEFVYGIKQILPVMNWELSIDVSNNGRWDGKYNGAIGTYNQYNKNSRYITTVKQPQKINSTFVITDSNAGNILNKISTYLNTADTEPPKIIYKDGTINYDANLYYDNSEDYEIMTIGIVVNTGLKIIQIYRDSMDGMVRKITRDLITANKNIEQLL